MPSSLRLPAGRGSHPAARAVTALRLLVDQPVVRALLVNAGSLASATSVTAALGLVYWLFAARQFSPSAVGLASAAVSGMTLVATFAALGFGTYAMGEAHREAGRARALVGSALVASGAVSVLLGVGYVFVAPVVSDELSPLAATPTTVLLFVVGAAATAVGLVLDQSLVGAMRGNVQLSRNIVFGVAKLALLVALGVAAVHSSGMSIFATWVAGAVLSLAAVGLLHPQWTGSVLAQARPRLVRGFLAEATPVVARHQLLNLSLKVPLLALPVLVVVVLSVEANASFYISWQLTNVAFVLPGSLATMLYAVGARDPGALVARLRLTLGLSAALTALAVLVLTAAAAPILSIFGEEYAADSRTLVLLALAGLPTVVKNHYVAISRVTRRIRPALPLLYGGAVLEMAVAYLGGVRGGLEGFAAGWLLVLTAEALFMTPLLLRTMRAGR